MPLGGSLYQISLALLIGIVLAYRSHSMRSQAGALGARASFVFGTAVMLFHETRWWPVTGSVFALVSWVLSGWFASRIGYDLAARLKPYLRNRKARPSPTLITHHFSR